MRVIEQGGCIYVIGTHDVQAAATALPSDVVSWNIAERGRYAKRKNGYRYYSQERMPKDARIGVRFGGVVRDLKSGGSE